MSLIQMCRKKLKRSLQSIDASSRQVVYTHATARQETHCQFLEIHVAEMELVLIQKLSIRKLRSKHRAAGAANIV
jgi:hypothetical protein